MRLQGAAVGKEFLTSVYAVYRELETEIAGQNGQVSDKRVIRPSEVVI